MFEKFLQLPVVRQLYAHRYERAFAGSWAGAFRGVYASFDEATRAAPATKPLGYDHPESGAMYAERFTRIVPADYPALFWLERALRAGGRSVFDLGGHVGLLFYGFRGYLDYPEGLRWTVLDVPSVIQSGAEIAATRGVSDELRFTSSLDDADGCDFLLASGSLQYLDGPSLAESVAKMKVQPRWIVINKTPISDGPEFVTLQNIGSAFCPYRIFNSARLIAPFERAGYTLVDRWQNADMSCILPLNPERSVKWYTGLLLERTVPGARSIRTERRAAVSDS